MKTRTVALPLLFLLAACSAGERATDEGVWVAFGPGSESREFTVASADSTLLTGQIDRPARQSLEGPVIVLVHGTGLFDRDVSLGRSGTPGDRVFADLAQAFTQEGIVVVRYDRRGVRYKPADGQLHDKDVAGTSTMDTLREDAGAVYAHARKLAGLQAGCTALLGHSEGMYHIAGLAAEGAPPPALVVGIGAPLQSPQTVLKWQLTERDAFSLRMMDEDGDGEVTEEEVHSNWKVTPSAVFGVVAPFLHPSGKWTPADIENVVLVQSGIYETGKAASLAVDDNAPYPDANTPMARYSWWKSWYTDDMPAARELSAWDVPMLFLYGDRDSQVRHEFQRPEADSYLGDRAEIQVLPGLGHSLGEDVLLAPMDTGARDSILKQVADRLKESCGGPA